ncbi:hypothetical protein BOX15_Mlig015071g3 [Macrostomum lignano]|uniref:Uncharacterized protein n=1 Tax=Macrostomum lignano TaxID=282301 RepID=A0A267FMW4_9PLAT|nr:hypothetical protein BOX15_Mlig015071g3 [Macrostomum lignano]
MPSLMKFFRGNRGRNGRSRERPQEQPKQVKQKSTSNLADARSSAAAASRRSTSPTQSKSSADAAASKVQQPQQRKRLASLRRSLSRLGGSIRRPRRQQPPQQQHHQNLESTSANSCSNNDISTTAMASISAGENEELQHQQQQHSFAPSGDEELVAVETSLATTTEAVEDDDLVSTGCTSIAWRQRRERPSEGHGSERSVDKASGSSDGQKAKEKKTKKSKTDSSGPAAAALSFFRRFPSVRRKRPGAEGDARAAGAEGGTAAAAANQSTSISDCSSPDASPPPPLQAPPPLPPRRTGEQPPPKAPPPLLPSRRIKELLVRPPYIASQNQQNGELQQSGNFAFDQLQQQQRQQPLYPVPLLSAFPTPLPRRYSHNAATPAASSSAATGTCCRSSSRSNVAVVVPENSGSRADPVVILAPPQDAQVTNAEDSEESLLASGMESAGKLADRLLGMMEGLAEVAVDEGVTSELVEDAADSTMIVREHKVDAVAVAEDPEVNAAIENIQSEVTVQAPIESNPDEPQFNSEVTVEPVTEAEEINSDAMPLVPTEEIVQPNMKLEESTTDLIDAEEDKTEEEAADPMEVNAEGSPSPRFLNRFFNIVEVTNLEQPNTECEVTEVAAEVGKQQLDALEPPPFESGRSPLPAEASSSTSSSSVSSQECLIGGAVDDSNLAEEVTVEAFEEPLKKSPSSVEQKLPAGVSLTLESLTFAGGISDGALDLSIALPSGDFESKSMDVDEEKLEQVSSASSLYTSSSSSSLASVSSAEKTSSSSSCSSKKNGGAAPASEVELVKSVAEAVSETETCSEATASVMVETNLVKGAVSALTPIELAKSSEATEFDGDGLAADASLVLSSTEPPNGTDLSDQGDTIRSLFISFRAFSDADEPDMPPALDSAASATSGAGSEVKLSSIIETNSVSVMTGCPCGVEIQDTVSGDSEDLVHVRCIIQEKQRQPGPQPQEAELEITDRPRERRQKQLEQQIQQQLLKQLESTRPLSGDDEENCVAASGVELQDLLSRAQHSASGLRFAEGIVVGPLE